MVYIYIYPNSFGININDETIHNIAKSWGTHGKKQNSSNILVGLQINMATCLKTKSISEIATAGRHHNVTKYEWCHILKQNRCPTGTSLINNIALYSQSPKHENKEDGWREYPYIDNWGSKEFTTIEEYLAIIENSRAF